MKSWGDFEEAEGDALVGPKDLARGKERKEAVGYLASGSCDADIEGVGLNHGWHVGSNLGLQGPFRGEEQKSRVGGNGGDSGDGYAERDVGVRG